jgi:hypothetical protein
MPLPAPLCTTKGNYTECGKVIRRSWSQLIVASITLVMPAQLALPANSNPTPKSAVAASTKPVATSAKSAPLSKAELLRRQALWQEYRRQQLLRWQAAQTAGQREMSNPHTPASVAARRASAIAHRRSHVQPKPMPTEAESQPAAPANN